MSDYDYGEDIQKLLIETMLSSEECYARSKSIINSKFFDQKFQRTIDFVKEHTDQFNEIPKTDLVKAKTGMDYSTRNDMTLKDKQWYLQTIEGFTKHRAIHAALVLGSECWSKGDYGTAETELKKALEVGLIKNIGINYFDSPKLRLEKLMSSNGQISTGFKAIDDKLFGGFSPGELNIFAGNSGTGKSLVLQNLAINFAFSGKNVVYISNELSEDLVSLRMDTMISGIPTKRVFKELTEVDLRVRSSSRGRIQIKYMNPGVNTNDIQSYLTEYEIQTKLSPDVLIVDYLDLLHPNSKRISLNDHFTKDKSVCEELRSLANDINVILVTASQLNRSAVSETEHDLSHIAGGLSKLNTADNVMTILSSPSLMERGVYRLQFLKTRSSSGVGSKIDLAYDNQTMRMTDEVDSGPKKDYSELGNEIKRKGKASGSDTVSTGNMNDLLDKVKKGQKLREKMYD